MSFKNAIVIGSGIVGLATARMLAKRNYRVKVFERQMHAIGASIRNFGMIWPIGQPSGKLYERALVSRNIWKQLSKQGVCWHEQQGSLHLAHDQREWKVLQELFELFRNERQVELLNPSQVYERSPASNPDNLLGGLYSGDEMIVDPREAIINLPVYLNEMFGVQFHWGKAVCEVKTNSVRLSDGQIHQADVIVICSGADFETLFPDIFASIAVTKCKLQMLRLEVQPDNWRIGPALCGGLTLIHYNSFKAAPSWQMLEQYYREEMPVYVEEGIHVMMSQHEKGDITLGDSHQYGNSPAPFDRLHINQLIMDYFKRFARVKDYSISETWHGIYAKMKNGATEYFGSPEPGVYILNGLGGAGMTLSFGLAEEVLKDL